MGTTNPKVVSKRLGGICLLGIGLSSEFAEDIKTVRNCMGGFSGTELINLPYAGGLLDQPARFLRVFEIVKSELDKYAEKQTKQSDSKARKPPQSSPQQR